MEFLLRASDTQLVPWDARDTGGVLARRKSPCSHRDAVRQIITLLLETGGVSALRGDEYLNVFMQLPVLLSENECEKR